MAEKQSNGNQKVSEQQVRREKLALLQEAGRDPFVQTKFTVTNFSTDITEHFDEMEGQIVTIAGRLMSKRGMGKAVLLRPAGQEGPRAALCPPRSGGRRRVRMVQKV